MIRIILLSRNMGILSVINITRLFTLVDRCLHVDVCDVGSEFFEETPDVTRLRTICELLCRQSAKIEHIKIVGEDWAIARGLR